MLPQVKNIRRDRNSPVSPDAEVQERGRCLAWQQCQWRRHPNRIMVSSCYFRLRHLSPASWADYFEGTSHDAVLMLFAMAASLLLWWTSPVNVIILFCSFLKAVARKLQPTCAPGYQWQLCGLHLQQGLVLRWGEVSMKASSRLQICTF